MSKSSILVVEDEEDLKEIYQEFLEDMDIFKSIIFASDVREALKKIENQKFHLIITDLNIPNGSGLDVIRRMKKISLNKTLKVILVSGFISKETLAEAKALGLKYALTKPVDPEKLEKIIKQVLNEN